VHDEFDMNCEIKIMVVIHLTKLKNLVGKKVVGVNGESIGEVKDVEFDTTDTTNWRISSMEVKLNDKAAMELGLKASGRSVGGLSRNTGTDTAYLPVELISAMGDVITVNKTLNEMTEGHLIHAH
jgi:sporulation protein YlmC with PRC-barrel domain